MAHAKYILFAAEGQGLIKIQPGKGEDAILFMASILTNAEEAGIEEAADRFETTNSYGEECRLSTFVKKLILELKE